MLLLCEDVCVCVCVCMCVCARARARVCVCVCVLARWLHFVQKHELCSIFAANKYRWKHPLVFEELSASCMFIMDAVVLYRENIP